MGRVSTAVWLISLGVAGIAPVQAQRGRDVPVVDDLRREQRIERDIARTQPPPVDPFVTPDNPDGVVGFDGPPGIVGDSVDNGGPLPPGSPADIDED